ncbi:MAG: toxic anion resistance protein [Clostridia bacterium]|nr:toxic anion resistance protein [Clostridia bacterium]
MSDTNETISLTLDPNGTAAAAAEAAAVAEAAEAAEAKEYGELDDSSLTEEERRIVEEFQQKIDITDSAMVMQYGAAAQQKVAGFSDAALQNVRTKDFGEVGDMMSKLVVELKGIEEPEKTKGFLGLFKRARYNINVMQAKYDKAEVNVDKIVDALENHQVVLLKDISTLDKMYDMNLSYLKELTMYILAGKKRLQTERETTLVELVEKAKTSGLPEDTQAANDFREKCERFEKKLYDLELTRTIAIQMAPQIRLVQNNDTLMTEKIQSTIVNTIPLWKSQMVIALGMAHSSQAMQAERAVNDMTNELLKKNAEALHQGTIEVARESERGIVDIETLTKTNEQLIQTLDEVQQIQAEGHAKRVQAEKELARMEGELRDKLLLINDNK